MTDRPLKQIHLAAHFPGVNNTTVWSDPASGSHIEFDSFRHLAETAERGKFDFFFLAEGLRLRENKGRIHDLDVVGRPESITVLNALAAVTTRLGLAATVNATFNEPYELARRFASLDHLSGGRAAWNVVTSSDAFTGENFRRGGYLDRADRYTRAAEFVQLAREFWDGGEETVRHQGPQFDVEGGSRCPARPRATRWSSRPGTPTRAGSSPPRPPTSSSAGTPPSPTARPSTRTSNAGSPRTAASRTS